MCLVVRGCGGGAVNVVVSRAVEEGTCRRACAAQTLGWLATFAVGRAFLVQVLASDRAPLVGQANDTARRSRGVTTCQHYHRMRKWAVNSLAALSLF